MTEPYSDQPIESPKDGALTEVLERIGRSGAAWRAFQRYYPDSNLNDSVRPR